jgi:hypothetical protein
MTFQQIRVAMNRNAVLAAEVPTEYFVSLPLPTLRCGAPGYACFAAPALYADSRTTVDTPDLWWVSDSAGRHMLLFAWFTAYPFGEIAAGRQKLTPVAATMDEVRSQEDAINALMSEAAPVFFAGDPGRGELRLNLATALGKALAPEITPWYRALAPDFFAWLG